MPEGFISPHRFAGAFSFLLCTYLCSFLFLLAHCHAAAQASEPQSSQTQTSEELTKTAESYEKFLQEASPGTWESTIEVREKLGAIYFLLHRYNDSLAVLKPALQGQEDSSSHDSSAVNLKGRALSPNARSLRTQSWLVSGLDYLELDQLPDSTRALRRALSMQPDNANARLALGDALARSGHMEEAGREYAEQTKLTPALPDAWYKLGLAHGEISVETSRHEVRPADESIIQQLDAEESLAKGDNLTAARTLFRVLHAYPKQAEIHADLGTALLELGYLKAAQRHLNQELVENPESPFAQIGLVQTAALHGNWGEVGAKLEHLSESEPRELTQLLESPPAGLVVQAWAKGQMNSPRSFSESPAGVLWKSWLSDSNVIAQISEDHASASHCVAQRNEMVPGIWMSERCYSLQIARLRKKPSLTTNERIKLTETEFRLGDYDAAVRSAKLLRAADPLSGWATYWLSKAHDALSEQCFLKVAALNPNSARVHQMLAEHYMKLSDYPRAKSEFQAAIRLTPASPDLHLGLGTVLSRAGDWAQAEKELKTTLEVSPQSSFAHYELGHVYVQQNLWQQAVSELRDVSEDSTVLLSARLDLAKAESELGDDAQAVKGLLSVALLDRDGELYFRLAALYRKIGDTAQARDALATFKQRRAASLQTDAEELEALEKEQEPGRPAVPQSP
jgi:tetratricopeptide (TPR) repeat protein